MEIIINGIITGLLLTIFVGATFFMLIETSMTRGFKAALWFDAGVVLCDISIITGVYFFTSWITTTLVNNTFFNVAGGIVFIGFGINYIVSRRKNDAEIHAKQRNMRVFLNGFVINLMNPAVILFWMGTMAITLSKFKYNGKETFIYYGTAILTMAFFDVVKAYFAYRLSNFIHNRVLRVIYIFSGLLMIGLGFYFIFKK